MLEPQALVAGAAITMTEDQPLLAPAFVRWEGRSLQEVRPATEEDPRTPGVRDLRSSAVLPGFVNAHHHVTSAGLTGVEPPSHPTLDGRSSGLRRSFVAAVGRAEAHDLATLGYLELARSGVTTTTDSQAPWRGDGRVDGALEAASRSGLRVHFSVAFLDRTDLIPREQQFNPGAAVEELERLRQAFAGDRLEVEGEPLSLPRASDELVVALHRVRRRRAAMHLTYSRAFEQWAEQELGHRAVEHLDHLGVLDEGWVFAHPIHLDLDEVRLLAEAGAGVAYCPVSNLHMGLESPDLRSLVGAGVPLGLGLDHPNGTHDVLQNAKVAAIVQRSVAGDPNGWTSLDSLRALTAGGATALGLEDSIGRLGPGFDADLVALTGLLPPAPTLATLSDRIVMGGAREHVTDVLAAGRWLVRDSVTVDHDLSAARARAADAQRRLLASSTQAGLE